MTRSTTGAIYLTPRQRAPWRTPRTTHLRIAGRAPPSQHSQTGPSSGAGHPAGLNGITLTRAKPKASSRPGCAQAFHRILAAGADAAGHDPVGANYHPLCHGPSSAAPEDRCGRRADLGALFPLCSTDHEKLGSICFGAVKDLASLFAEAITSHSARAIGCARRGRWELARYSRGLIPGGEKYRAPHMTSSATQNRPLHRPVGQTF